jgi:hypothetical protein
MDVVLKKSQGYLFWDVCYLKNGHEKCQNMAKFSPTKRNILNFSLKLNNFYVFKDNQLKLFEVLEEFMTFQ